MPQPYRDPSSQSGYEKFVNATLTARLLSAGERATEASPRVSQSQPPSATDLVGRRVADIVLSAVDDNDLRQALDKALDGYEFHTDNTVADPDMLLVVRDPEFPIEVRELMLQMWFAMLADIASTVASREHREVPAWLSRELAHFVEIGNQAVATLRGMTEADWRALDERRKAKEREVDEFAQRAAESGQDAYSPFGHPDD